MESNERKIMSDYMTSYDNDTNQFFRSETNLTLLNSDNPQINCPEQLNDENQQRDPINPSNENHDCILIEKNPKSLLIPDVSMSIDPEPPVPPIINSNDSNEISELASSINPLFDCDRRPCKRKRNRNPFIAFFVSMYSRRRHRRAADVARQAGRQWGRMSERQKRKYAANSK